MYLELKTFTSQSIHIMTLLETGINHILRKYNSTKVHKTRRRKTGMWLLLLFI